MKRSCFSHSEFRVDHISLELRGEENLGIDSIEMMELWFWLRCRQQKRFHGLYPRALHYLQVEMEWPGS
jgi:hypothetical protein